MTGIAALRRALAQPGRRGWQGDWEVNTDAAPPASATLMPAAVLIAVTDAPVPMLVLTLRPVTMRRHAGQVAFPGGRIDPGDAGPIDAALREAEEEVALPRAAVEVLGTLETYETGTGFAITPVVGIIAPGLTLVPHEREVAAVFEVPLAEVLDPTRHQLRQSEWQGRLRTYYVIESAGRSIWGATAGIIVNLSRRLA